MGRTGEMDIEFDPGTETASMSVSESRTFRVGPRYLLTSSTDELMNTALHEGAHADITRIGSGYFFSSAKMEALRGIVEDIRTNARVADRMPGRREEFLADRERRYRIDPSSLSPSQEANLQKLLPHEAFLQGLMSREYGKTSPWDTDPVIGPALDEAWAGLQHSKAERPGDASPSEAAVMRHMLAFEGIVKNEIEPIFDRLYRESMSQVEQMIKDGKFEIVKGGGSGIDPKDLSDAARKIIEDRAQKIADKFAPKGTLGDKGKKARVVYRKDGKEPGDDGKPSKPSGAHKPGTLGGVLAQRHDDYIRQQKALQGKPFSKFLSDLGQLPNRVFAVFDQLLKPNTDFEFDGYFTSGPRPDIERAIRAMHGWLDNLKVFLRKTEPTARNHRFSLLLDASGSMADEAARERGGLGLASLFVDVFERLELPYSLDAFHGDYIPLKGFETSLKTVQARNDLFNQFMLNHWGGPATNIRAGIVGSLRRIMKQRMVDPRDVDFLFVLTDGEENVTNGPEIRKLCEEAARHGIIVVGIGIGEGMQTVKDYFPVHLVESDPNNLPKLMAEFIKEYVKSTQED